MRRNSGLNQRKRVHFALNDVDFIERASEYRCLIIELLRTAWFLAVDFRIERAGLPVDDLSGVIEIVENYRQAVGVTKRYDLAANAHCPERVGTYPSP